jgi:hypothetical protein
MDGFMLPIKKGFLGIIWLGMSSVVFVHAEQQSTQAVTTFKGKELGLQSMIKEAPSLSPRQKALAQAWMCDNKRILTDMVDLPVTGGDQDLLNSKKMIDEQLKKAGYPNKSNDSFVVDVGASDGNVSW